MPDCPYCGALEPSASNWDAKQCDHVLTQWISDPEVFMEDSLGVYQNNSACESLVDTLFVLFGVTEKVASLMDEAQQATSGHAGPLESAYDELVSSAPAWFASFPPNGSYDTVLRWLLCASDILDFSTLPELQQADQVVGGCGTSVVESVIFAEDPEVLEKSMSSRLMNYKCEAEKLITVLNAFLDEHQQGEETDPSD